MNPQSNQELIPVYNPTTEDFNITYDINNDNLPVSYTLPARQIGYFEPIIADHIANHLAKKVAAINEFKPNPELAFQNAITQILVAKEIEYE